MIGCEIIKIMNRIRKGLRRAHSLLLLCGHVAMNPTSEQVTETVMNRDRNSCLDDEMLCWAD